MNFSRCALLILLFAASIVLSSCKKYPNGPKFTLLTKKIRVWEKWECTEYFENGVDMSAYLPPSEIFCVFSTDKSSYFGTYNNSVAGTWQFQNKKTEIFLASDTPSMSPSRTFKILKLKESKLWLQETVNGVTYEYHFFSRNPTYILDAI